MNYTFRVANPTDLPKIWEIIKQAILRRKNDGSTQWQDGYPNETLIENDIEQGNGYVLIEGIQIIGYTAIIFNDEPAYEDLKGTWLTNEEFAVIHRLAISDDYIGKGLAQKIMHFTEEVAIQNHIFSIKVDTNFDNNAMLNIFEKLGYSFCGEVSFRGGIRKAFEKTLRII
ncbi:GNAT family N-acetyltransferase [Flavobacterium sp.]|uniref:GNAT family N-acetyltransferase n=1 Tax=Flavobacterium sp. TaxID=239 RepID=UPI002486D157|nr:GNAT family N-acetyltransferase [Flavobacterium sp.]MDI1315740.1 GNAT family N-acetyltransferase [Flavobacterium sp.]